MAAWVGRIDEIVGLDKGTLRVNVTYWASADTGFVTQLGQASFEFVPGTAQAVVVTRIRSTGGVQRDAQDAAAALQSFVGQTVSIP